MNLNDLQGVQEILNRHRLVPVVSLPTVEAALKLSEILTRCNLPVIEVTFRTASALQGIAAIKREFPQLLILAGTVLSEFQVLKACEAGASAVVSPGFTPKMAAFCKEREIPFFPGVCTPSEIQMALDAGLDILKFFPAEQAGGTKMISLFQSLYQDVRFMPTGGINPDNLTVYLGHSNIICCGGTWLSPEKLMAAGHWEEIERRVTDALQVIGNIS